MKYYRHKDSYRNYWLITVERVYQKKSLWNVVIYTEVDNKFIKHMGFETKTIFGSEPTLSQILSEWSSYSQNVMLGFAIYAKDSKSWIGSVQDLLKTCWGKR